MTGSRSGLGPIGRRLLAAFVLVATSSVIVLAAGAYFGVDRGVQAATGNTRHQTAQSAAAVAADSYERAGGWSGANLDRVLAIADAASVQMTVVNSSGHTVGSTTPEMGMMNSAMAGTPQATASVVVAGTTVGEIRVFSGSMMGTRVFGVAWMWIAVAAIVALIMAIGASWWVTRRLVQPVRVITSAAQAFTAGQRDRRATGDAPGELGELAIAFNGMADAVVASDTQRRNMTADVAHELRTPLAALQAGLEELRDGLVAPSPESFARLHDQSLRLGRTLADLAELSAVETSGMSLSMAKVNLSAIARDELALREPQLRAAGLTIRSDLAGYAWIRGDSDRLHQAIGNLLANAASYCRPGDTVTISTQATAGGIKLSVADTGPGIPEDELPHVFDRLWRGRGATGVSGSGIGLAVVREVAIRHGGEVRARSSTDGTEIVVTLPTPKN